MCCPASKREVSIIVESVRTGIRDAREAELMDHLVRKPESLKLSYGMILGRR
jgi:hypothetical protein